MRNFRLSAAVIVALVVPALQGCGGEEPPPKMPEPPAPAAPAEPAPQAQAPVETPAAAPKPSMADMQVATEKAQIAAVDSCDAKGAAGAYSDNAVWKMAGMPEIRGREAIAGHIQQFCGSFSKIKHTAWRSFQKNDVMVTEWIINMDHSGDFMGTKASNKPVGLHAASVSWFDGEGKIKEQHMYFDVPTLMAQIGASKEKARPVATAPGSATEMFVSKGTPEEDKNLDLAKSMYAAWDNKKEADFLNLLTDTTQYDDFTQPMTHKGKTEAKKSFAMITKAFPDGHTTVVNGWGVGDYVITESNFKGTNKGPMGPMKATNKPVDFMGVDIYKVNGGKIDSGWSYSNSFEPAMQMGLVKAPKMDGAAGAAKADAKADAKATDKAGITKGAPQGIAKGEPHPKAPPAKPTTPAPAPKK